MSAAKVAMLGEPSAVAVVAEDRTIVGIGVVAPHRQPQGHEHWSAETAVEPSLQFVEFERAVLSATLELVPRRAPRSVWAHRSATVDALSGMDFREVRSLAYMAVDLPVDVPNGEQPVRPFEEGDRMALVDLNNAAFTGHREVGSMSEDDFLDYAGASWFDPAGIVVLEIDGAIVGFCWTKVHDNGDGEIFRIGVAPDLQGKGFGRTLLAAGFTLLAADDRVRRGSLWVDESNATAMALYTTTGMHVERRNREFEPAM